MKALTDKQIKAWLVEHDVDFTRDITSILNYLSANDWFGVNDECYVSYEAIRRTIHKVKKSIQRDYINYDALMQFDHYDTITITNNSKRITTARTWNERANGSASAVNCSMAGIYDAIREAGIFGFEKNFEIF